MDHIVLEREKSSLQKLESFALLFLHHHSIFCCFRTGTPHSLSCERHQELMLLSARVQVSIITAWQHLVPEHRD
ncbi:hypothetical protein IAQ61_002919 [Plenodomus lingam]|uniref:uncharacterized protein n=1 Tax=Leptosphaeria maculans TaxID=5022 RepID=UPI003317F5EA|nr:hypothetical protein IAQ61_002919 [Plenodomus lingam]